MMFAALMLLVALWQIVVNRRDLSRKQKEIEQRVYETKILQEIGERIGYELNISRILDTIIESLERLIPFSFVGYMLIQPDEESVLFRMHIEDTVSKSFIDTTKAHMMETLEKISNKTYGQDQLIEKVTGTIIDETSKEGVASLWVTPLLINSRGIGVMAVASRKSGLYQGPEMEILTKLLSQANHAVNNLEDVIGSEQRKIKAMVASITDGVIMLDQDLNLIVINAAAATLLGLSTEDKITIFEVAKSLADRVDLRTKIEESSQTNKIVTFENLVINNRISQIIFAPVHDSSAKLVGTVVIFHDVTAQKQLDQVRQEFTAMMVHELRAPLTVVRGTSDMFVNNPQLALEPQGKELLQMMEKSATTMLDLVNSLLDVAKIESGKFQIIKSPSSLTELIGDRVRFFEQAAKAKSLQIVAKLPSDSLEFSFDKDRIAQVLNNLLSNAIKFSSVGGTISVVAQQIKTSSDIVWRFDSHPSVSVTRPSVLIAISDSGSGIADKEMGELFSKFRQLKEGVHTSSGTGLGLVIAKGIVESHDGQIAVESKINEGSTFYVILPTDSTLDN